jgi:hypothetical protein
MKQYMKLSKAGFLEAHAAMGRGGLFLFLLKVENF